MGEQFYMACILSLASMAAVIFLAWTNGLHRFNPTWIVAANTTVIMVWMVYGATWLLRLCVRLEWLLRALAEQQPEITGHPPHPMSTADDQVFTSTVSDDVTDSDAAA